ncbi:arginine decarboxylase [Rhodothermaceae bacterium RA]|nr:arginine decarboxylase [Rhodothermaceae bacterium RA]
MNSDVNSPTLETDATWTTADAEALYRVDAWSDGYFFVNDAGHVAVSPEADRSRAIDLKRLVDDLRQEGLTFPVLIRFHDILRARVEHLNAAFARAIEEFGYANRYTSVYPIKVNQLHEVVEEILDAGRPYGLGLECGSKAELVAALPHLESDDTLLICNGYKDPSMLRLILTGQQLGKSVIPVVEKFGEFEGLLRLAREMDVRPRFGVRIHLSTRGAGKWAESSGDRSKFGVTIPELVRIITRLKAERLEDALVLLHFHLGSQIADIQPLKQAVKEVAQVYVQLHARGIGVRYIDVGGGLGVNYASGYSDHAGSINYSLQEYANSIVYAVKEVCDAAHVPVPALVSESGRALTAHHSVLIVEALQAYRKDEIQPDFRPAEADHQVIHELYATLEQVRAYRTAPPDRLPARLLEAYHDAAEKRQESNLLFSLGYLPLEQKALAENLYWSICRAIHEQVDFDAELPVPAELLALDDRLIDQYLCDFSVFQSMLDHWAIGQRFPIMPIARLDEPPDRRGVLVDLTCDSDGKVSHYVDADEEKDFLELHTPRPDEPYFLAFFLMGAYQDIMGDMHNLFGRTTEVHVYFDEEEPNNYYIEKTIPGATVEEMLSLVQYFPNDLHRRMNGLIRRKIEAGHLRPKAGMEILARYDAMFKQMTYYNPQDA